MLVKNFIDYSKLNNKSIKFKDLKIFDYDSMEEIDQNNCLDKEIIYLEANSKSFSTKLFVNLYVSDKKPYECHCKCNEKLDDDTMNDVVNEIDVDKYKTALEKETSVQE